MGGVYRRPVKASVSAHAPVEPSPDKSLISRDEYRDIILNSIPKVEAAYADSPLKVESFNPSRDNWAMMSGVLVGPSVQHDHPAYMSGLIGRHIKAGPVAMTGCQVNPSGGYPSLPGWFVDQTGAINVFNAQTGQYVEIKTLDDMLDRVFESLTPIQRDQIANILRLHSTHHQSNSLDSIFSS